MKTGQLQLATTDSYPSSSDVTHSSNEETQRTDHIEMNVMHMNTLKYDTLKMSHSNALMIPTPHSLVSKVSAESFISETSDGSSVNVHETVGMLTHQETAGMLHRYETAGSSSSSIPLIPQRLIPQRTTTQGELSPQMDRTQNMVKIELVNDDIDEDDDLEDEEDDEFMDELYGSGDADQTDGHLGGTTTK